jgi:hypothetical protein
MEKAQRIKRVFSDDGNPNYRLFGEPYFLNGDERRNYYRLRDAVEKAVTPTHLFDYQDVAEIAFSIIEISRFRKAQIALIKSPVLLAELLTFAFADNSDKARNVALHYFSDDINKANAAADLIEAIGINRDQIEGHAIVSQAQETQALDSLVQMRHASTMRREKSIKKRRDDSAIDQSRPRNGPLNDRDSSASPHRAETPPANARSRTSREGRLTVVKK